MNSDVPDNQILTRSLTSSPTSYEDAATSYSGPIKSFENLLASSNALVDDLAHGKNAHDVGEVETNGMNFNNDDMNKNSDTLCKFINKSMFGKNYEFKGPFGLRKILYADFVASGRSLSFVEDFIINQVLPEYANTHTSTSITALQTSLYRLEAKDIVRNAVRALDTDAVIFAGSGCTGAISKLIHSLALVNKPVTLIGPFEHHSNLLPWRHISERWHRIEIDEKGTVSLDHLERLLKLEFEQCNKQNRKILVCMNAASNITGILTDVDAVCALVHFYGAHIFFDYAASAPYVKIDMNPVWVDRPENQNLKSKLIYKDAIYFSAHKFIGGPQSSGVLVVKKNLLKPSEVHPETPGGGTVFLVTRNKQFYLSDVENREEGGTPAIVEDIRTGIVLKLKESVGIPTIMNNELKFLSLMWQELSTADSLVILGGSESPRLPIISFVVTFDKGSKTRLLLHHNFVATLLNDLFGIQCRGGCACAGPYAMDLLGLNDDLALRFGRSIIGEQIDDRLKNSQMSCSSKEILRPGFVRFSLPYFMDPTEVQFILDAVKFVSKNGWMLLPLYKVDYKTGIYSHLKWDPMKERKWLHDINFTHTSMKANSLNAGQGPDQKYFSKCMKEAQEVLDKTVKLIRNGSISAVDNTVSPDLEFEKLRWFLLACEAIATIQENATTLSSKGQAIAPFWPVEFGKVDSNHEPTPEQVDDCSSQQLSFKEIEGERDSFASYKTASEHRLRYHYSGVFEPLPDRKFQSENKNASATSIRTNKTLQINEGGIIKQLLPSRNVPAPATVVDWNQDSFCDSTSRQFTIRDLDAKTVNSSHVETRLLQAQTSSSKLDDTDNDDIKSGIAIKNSSLHSEASKCPKNNKAIRWNASIARSTSGWRNPLPILFKNFLKGVRQFDMIKPGDRVLVCLSGGKDSLSLLHCLHQYRAIIRREESKKHGISEQKMIAMAEKDPHFFTFELAAITIDPGSDSYDPSPLIDYVRQLGIPYFYEKQGIIRQASELPYECSSICSFCSRMKRGRIYATARKMNYNVVALGQHLDDLVESFFMAAFHQGALNTMKANYVVKSKDLRVIRPFVFVREWQTRKFSELAMLPIIPENCPACFLAPKERARIKRILAEQETLFPRLYDHMKNALIPLMSNKDALGLNAQENAAHAMCQLLNNTKVDVKPADKNIPRFSLSDSESE